MTKNKQLVVAVIGTRQSSTEQSETAEKVGRELAKRGATLLCGGMGGVMEAACKGALAEGGLTIGILPGDNRQSANNHVQIPIVTGLGYARNVIVVKSAQAVIAIGGGYGTLSEIAFALQSGIPVIGLNIWSFSRENQVDQSIIPAKNAKDAVDKAISLAFQ